jgi:beta-phosphoglucomutase family hydrolase
VDSLKAVLWDMDGTLIDSAAVHFQAWVEALAVEGYTLTHENFVTYFGRRNDDIIRAYLGSQTSAETIDRISLDKEERYRAVIRRDGITFLPGVERWLKRLADEGWRQAVATSAPRLNVEAILEVTGRATYFAAISAAEDVAVSKPDPAVFLLAAERLGVPPSRCVVVEDAPAGIEGARRGGMRSVGICGLHDVHGDLTVRSLEELADDAFDRLLAA